MLVLKRSCSLTPSNNTLLTLFFFHGTCKVLVRGGGGGGGGGQLHCKESMYVRDWSCLALPCGPVKFNLVPD